MVVVDDQYSLLPFLERFFQLVYASGVEAEREACAKLCQNRADGAPAAHAAEAWLCAAAIRART